MIVRHYEFAEADVADESAASDAVDELAEPK